MKNIVAQQEKERKDFIAQQKKEYKINKEQIKRVSKRLNTSIERH